MAQLQAVKRYIGAMFLIENGESLNLNSVWWADIKKKLEKRGKLNEQDNQAERY